MLNIAISQLRVADGGKRMVSGDLAVDDVDDVMAVFGIFMRTRPKDTLRMCLRTYEFVSA